MFGIGDLFGLGAGVLGLMQGKDSQGNANDMYRSAAEFNKRRGDAWDWGMDKLKHFDYMSALRKAMDYGKETAGSVLNRNLKTLNSDFKKQGGTPGGDTLFDTESIKAQMDAYNPLAKMAAEGALNEVPTTLGLLGGMMGSGQDIASTYMNMGQGYGQQANSYSSSAAGLLANVFNHIGQKGK